MIPGDSICFYLTEGVKDGAETHFKGVSDEGIFLQARATLPEMIASSNTLKKRLERAAKTGSRMDAIDRLRALRSRGPSTAPSVPKLSPPESGSDLTDSATKEDGCSVFIAAV